MESIGRHQFHGFRFCLSLHHLPVQQPVPQSPSITSGESCSMPNRIYTPPSPHKPADSPSYASSQSPSGYEGGGQKTAHLNKKKLSSVSSQSIGTGEKCYTRPKGPLRLSTGKGITTLERIWGPLFDEGGHPTIKLSQFLRGLAIHIVRMA